MKDLLQEETEKYEKIWKIPEYSFWSSEMEELDSFLDWIHKKPIKRILVAGCGQGFGLHWLDRAGYDVEGLDIVDVLRFVRFKNQVRFWTDPIWDTGFEDMEFDVVFCCDVLEHIPEEKIEKSLQEINRITKFWYFRISCRPDKFGVRIGEVLHLIDRSSYWWMKIISKYLSIEGHNHSLYKTLLWRNHHSLVARGRRLF